MKFVITIDRDEDGVYIATQLIEVILKIHLR
jgi:hypothetical protein